VWRREEALTEESVQLLPLKSVFDCSYIELRVKDGKDGWECVWCGRIFTQRHASRALKHVLKIKKSDIAVCKATIPERYRARYWALFSAGQVRLESKKRSNAFVEEYVASLHNSAVDNLLQKKSGGVVVSGSSVLFIYGSFFQKFRSGKHLHHRILHHRRKEAFTICFLVSEID
jgi:hypothetical protein